MFTYTWLFVGLLALVLFNCLPAVKTEPLFRIGFSLVIIGFGIIPLSIWMIFLPSFALFVIGIILIALSPIDYCRRHKRK